LHTDHASYIKLTMIQLHAGLVPQTSRIRIVLWVSKDEYETSHNPCGVLRLTRTNGAAEGDVSLGDRFQQQTTSLTLIAMHPLANRFASLPESAVEELDRGTSRSYRSGNCRMQRIPSSLDRITAFNTEKCTLIQSWVNC